MRIYSLMEGSNTYFWQDVNITNWSSTGLTSTTPDGQDWLSKLSNFPATAIIGLTRTGSQVWFGWSAGTDKNFQQPHIEIAEFEGKSAGTGVEQQLRVCLSCLRNKFLYR